MRCLSVYVEMKPLPVSIFKKSFFGVLSFPNPPKRYKSCSLPAAAIAVCPQRGQLFCEKSMSPSLWAAGVQSKTTLLFCEELYFDLGREQLCCGMLRNQYCRSAVCQTEQGQKYPPRYSAGHRTSCGCQTFLSFCA